MRNRIIKILYTTAFLLQINSMFSVAQDSLQTKELIGVLGRPSSDSITLRWAPMNFDVWQKGNKYGYVIKRYTIVRDSTVLLPVELQILNAVPIQPKVLDDWEALVKKDKYAAIAAQAIYGDQFQVNLGESNIMTIINKAKEQEQRYSFALFCADMSSTTAIASGLWYADKTVKENEKYLYRIEIFNGEDSTRGSVFIGQKDSYQLPKPQQLKADFKFPLVSLQWDKDIFGYYTAYRLERSLDGTNFKTVSDNPLLTLNPDKAAQNRFEYASDSIGNIGTEYQYRVRGISPFGEVGPPSEVVKGKSTRPLNAVPFIIKGEVVNTGTVRLTWELDEQENTLIKGFAIERADKAKGDYKVINKELLPSTNRTFEYLDAKQINYYRIRTFVNNGDEHISPPYLVQLIDSIAPLAPIELKVKVDDLGNVELSWKENEEEDLFGYRVYRSNFSDEELVMLTGAPIQAIFYADKVNVNSLQESVFYSVAAVDRNQNESLICPRVKLVLPDKIKPQTPVFLPIKSSETGVSLSWLPSGSSDVVRYDVYRKANNNDNWVRLKMIPATLDSVFQYLDTNLEDGQVSVYTITAVDDAGLESAPATAVRGVKIDNLLRPSIEWKDYVINRETKTLTLHWSYQTEEVTQFRIYRSVDNNDLSLYKTIDANTNHFIDKIFSVKQYNYAVLPVLKNGRKAKMSEMISVNY